MNKSIRFTSRIALILTAILLVNLTVVQAFSTDKYCLLYTSPSPRDS